MKPRLLFFILLPVKPNIISTFIKNNMRPVKSIDWTNFIVIFLVVGLVHDVVVMNSPNEKQIRQSCPALM
jgi:hypothetical protein